MVSGLVTCARDLLSEANAPATAPERLSRTRLTGRRHCADRIFWTTKAGAGDRRPAGLCRSARRYEACWCVNPASPIALAVELTRRELCFAATEKMSRCVTNITLELCWGMLAYNEPTSKAGGKYA